MNNTNGKTIALRVVAAMLIAQCTFMAIGARATTVRTITGAAADVDLSSEERILDAFVTDLCKFDKRSADLKKQPTLTRVQVDSLQGIADDLTRRVSAVQNALREVIRKLKAAGAWDQLDQTVSARVNDPAFREFVRREGLKKTLEEAASNISNSANEIPKPLDLLRTKVQASGKESVFDTNRSALISRAVRVGYHPAPAVFGASFRCRLASARYGVAGFVFGFTPKLAKATANHNCQCFDVAGPTGCDFQ